MKEKREGYEWRDLGDDKGYWVKIKKDGRLIHKVPLFCPVEKCRRITSTIDDPYLEKYGVCHKCYIMYVDKRKEPLIDLEYYKKRFKERGY